MSEVIIQFLMGAVTGVVGGYTLLTSLRSFYRYFTERGFRGERK